MRYVLIRDDADVATIDEALESLRAKRAACRLAIIRGWIQDDIDELLDMRAMA